MTQLDNLTTRERAALGALIEIEALANGPYWQTSRRWQIANIANKAMRAIKYDQPAAGRFPVDDLYPS